MNTVYKVTTSNLSTCRLTSKGMSRTTLREFRTVYSRSLVRCSEHILGQASNMQEHTGGIPSDISLKEKEFDHQYRVSIVLSFYLPLISNNFWNEHRTRTFSRVWILSASEPFLTGMAFHDAMGFSYSCMHQSIKNSATVKSIINRCQIGCSEWSKSNIHVSENLPSGSWTPTPWLKLQRGEVYTMFNCHHIFSEIAFVRLERSLRFGDLMA
jgi:hypothetical protein